MITTEEIKHLAKLSRIELSEDEAAKMASDVDAILEYVGQISSVTGDTETVSPKLCNVMRDDIPTNTSGEYTEKILTNAPSREGNYLKVKKIL